MDNNNIYFCAVNEVITQYVDRTVKWDWKNPAYKYRVNSVSLPAVAIFGPAQGDLLEHLKKNMPANMKIVFESKKAKNRNYGFDKYAETRNTLVVLDKVENEAVPQVP